MVARPPAGVEARRLEHRADVPERVVELGVGAAVEGGAAAVGGRPGRAACAGSSSCRRRSARGTPVTAPSRALKVRSSTASVSPKRLVRFWISMVGMPRVWAVHGPAARRRGFALCRESRLRTARHLPFVATIGRGQEGSPYVAVPAFPVPCQCSVGEVGARRPCGAIRRRRTRLLAVVLAGRGARLAVRGRSSCCGRTRPSTSRQRPGSSWRSWPRRCRWRCADGLPLSRRQRGDRRVHREPRVASPDIPALQGAVHHRLGHAGSRSTARSCTDGRAVARRWLVGVLARRCSAEVVREIFFDGRIFATSR